jgi:hypothetical protein
VLHETLELVRQRVFGLCAGYADCNDAARLAHDPIHKLVLERDPAGCVAVRRGAPGSRLRSPGHEP